jgi:hypothetical protein
MSDDGNSYRTKFPEPDWHEIAEKAASEADPKKLAFLIKALCDRLDQLQRSGNESGDDEGAASPLPTS